MPEQTGIAKDPGGTSSGSVDTPSRKQSAYGCRLRRDCLWQPTRIPRRAGRTSGL